MDTANWKVDVDCMDTSIHPGTDFWQYACGRWAEHNPRPEGYTSWGTTTKVFDQNVHALAALVQDLAARQHPVGSVEQKIADLHNLYLNTARLDAEGATPLEKYFDEIRAIHSRRQLLRYLATHHRGLLFSIGLPPDDKDSRRHIVEVSQCCLGLGDRDYYLSDDPEKKKVFKAFRQHCYNLLATCCGFDARLSRRLVREALALERRMAEVSYSLEQLRDPEANYHLVTLDQLTARTHNFPWHQFLRDFSFDATTEVNLAQPEAVALACRLLMKDATLGALRSLLIVREVLSSANCLGKAFEDESLAYSTQTTGRLDMPPRWKRAVNFASSIMDDAVGQMYVQRHFPAEAKREMLNLVGNLRTALRHRIEAQNWMSDATKHVAIEKLDAVAVKIGYPDRWDDLSGLTVDPSLSLLDNVHAISDFYWQLNRDKRYNKPVDRTQWHMSAFETNAYYSPYSNEVCFPAGFLRPPFFSLHGDPAANYGAIGMVIGHELTHGFDDQGRKFDKDGNLRQWWSDEDIARFQQPCDQMADYFSSLWVIPGELHANGRLTLGENIADHGGLMIAFEALQMYQRAHGPLPVVDGFTPEQRFFIAYAQMWTDTLPDKLKRRLTQTGVHSLSFLRVNGTLPHIDAWYDAFHIQPSHPLYLAPEQRVRIW